MYETFERGLEPGLLPGCEDLVRMWQNKRGDRPVPAWTDFDFHDFTGWHGRITLADVTYDPFDFRYRLVGTKVAERLRKDYTGKFYTQMVQDGMDPIDDFEFYEMICRGMLVARLSGDLRWAGKTSVSVTFVDFPLSDDGTTTTQILTAML